MSGGKDRKEPGLGARVFRDRIGGNFPFGLLTAYACRQGVQLVPSMEDIMGNGARTDAVIDD